MNVVLLVFVFLKKIETEGLLIIAGKSKFNVTKDREKRTFDGITYDSITEMKFYRDWILPKMESGDITACYRQVRYELQKKFIHDNKTVLPIIYVSDFTVTYKNGHQIVYDVKGMPDSIALLKRKLFWYKYPDIDYRWMSYSKIDSPDGDGWVSYELVKQGRKERKKAKAIKN